MNLAFVKDSVMKTNWWFIWGYSVLLLAYFFKKFLVWLNLGLNPRSPGPLANTLTATSMDWFLNLLWHNVGLLVRILSMGQIEVEKWFVFDRNTWYYVTVCKLFVLRIITWSCNGHNISCSSELNLLNSHSNKMLTCFVWELTFLLLFTPKLIFIIFLLFMRRLEACLLKHDIESNFFFFFFFFFYIKKNLLCIEQSFYFFVFMTDWPSG